MDLPFLVFSVLLCAITCSADKGVKAAKAQSVTLQPWLVGLTAVVGFLLIVFIVLIVYRLRRRNRKGQQDWGYAKTVDIDGGQFKQTSM
ncbi:uncharacterized protein smim24 [Betta splendens]|uniref:Uncharacterized protein smim24 n=1 Tax=Betta splendens TaxID=158456 RepID=A0A6P7MCZ3_BETSP|nr:uncharacterized protein smim24 [Betta splendens]